MITLIANDQAQCYVHHAIYSKHLKCTYKLTCLKSRAFVLPRPKPIIVSHADVPKKGGEGEGNYGLAFMALPKSWQHQQVYASQEHVMSGV